MIEDDPNRIQTQPQQSPQVVVSNIEPANQNVVQASNLTNSDQTTNKEGSRRVLFFVLALVLILIVAGVLWVILEKKHSIVANTNNASKASQSKRTGGVSSPDGKVSVTLPSSWGVIGTNPLEVYGPQNISYTTGKDQYMFQDPSIPNIYHATFAPRPGNNESVWLSLGVSKSEITAQQALQMDETFEQATQADIVTQNNDDIAGHDASFVAYNFGPNVSPENIYFISDNGYLVSFSAEKVIPQTTSIIDSIQIKP